MLLQEFITFTRRIKERAFTAEHRVDNALLGLAARIGNLANLYHTALEYKVKYTKKSVLRELGYLHHYTLRIADSFGMDIKLVEECIKEVPKELLTQLKGNCNLDIHILHQQYTKTIFSLGAFGQSTKEDQQKNSQELYRRVAELIAMIGTIAVNHDSTLDEVQNFHFRTVLATWYERFKLFLSGK